MITSQQIIERSIYASILTKLIEQGLTLNPEEYSPVTEQNAVKYNIDRQAIIDDKGVFIPLFGTGNSQSRGEKTVPRIVIDTGGFYPGDFGLDNRTIDKEGDSFIVSEVPFEAIDQQIDIRLIYNKSTDGRLLHALLHTAIPQRGYIKPHNQESKPFDGNIFIYLSNYYSMDNTDKGLSEDVYQFMVKDTLINPLVVLDTIKPISEINYIINSLELSINP
jgi:hypothetical protein